MRGNQINKNKSAFILEEYDYNKFKLFVLSLVWRASVSRQDIFENVSLGPYEEELRKVILNEVETPVDRFPSFIYQTYVGVSPSDGVFLEIYRGKSKHDGKTIYQFIADGMFFFVGVGRCSIHSFPNGSSVCPGVLRIACDQLTKVDPFIDVFDRIIEQGKISKYESH